MCARAWPVGHASDNQPRPIEACLVISSIRSVWATVSRAIVQWKNGAGLIKDSSGCIWASGEMAISSLFLRVWTRGAESAHVRDAAVVFFPFFFFFFFAVRRYRGISCFQLWEILGQMNKNDLGLRTSESGSPWSWHPPHDGSSFCLTPTCQQLHVRRQNLQESRWWLKMACKPTRVFFWALLAALQFCNTSVEDLHCCGRLHCDRDVPTV